MGLVIGTLMAKAGLDVDGASFSAFNTALSNTSEKINGMSNESKLALAATAASVPATIASVAGVGLAVASNFEDASTTLTTLYGNVDTAKEKFQNLSAFAASTPFEFPELLDATVKLKSYGIEAGDYLQVLGDTSSAMGKTLNDSVEALADAQTGEFERLKEFGIKTMDITAKNAQQLGVSADQAGKTAMMYTDKWGKQQVAVVDRNNRDMITSTITGIWNDKYAGAMEARSKTLSGMMSTLKDNLSMSLADLVGFNMDDMSVQAGSLMSAIEGLVGMGIKLTGWLSGVSEPVQTFIVGVGVAASAVGLLAAGFIAYGAILPMITAAQVALGVSLTAALWPVAAGIIAFGAIAAALYLLNEKTGIVTAAWNTFKDVLTITVDAVERLIGWLSGQISYYSQQIYTYLSNLIPPQLVSTVNSVASFIGGIVGGITGQIHTSAENIRADNQNVQTSTQGVGTTAGATGLQVAGAGSIMQTAFGTTGAAAGTMGTQVAGATTGINSAFGATGAAAGTMGTQVAGAGTTMTGAMANTAASGQSMASQFQGIGSTMGAVFGNTGAAAGSMGGQVETATGKMSTGFAQSSTGAEMMAGKIIGVSPAVGGLTSAVNSGTSANQSYAASFVDVSKMASSAASAAISASSAIGSAIKTSASQVGNIAALAGKWNVSAKLGIKSSGGSGTGEGTVKYIPAKTTNNITVKT